MDRESFETTEEGTEGIIDIIIEETGNIAWRDDELLAIEIILGVDPDDEDAIKVESEIYTVNDDNTRQVNHMLSPMEYTHLMITGINQLLIDLQSAEAVLSDDEIANIQNDRGRWFDFLENKKDIIG